MEIEFNLVGRVHHDDRRPADAGAEHLTADSISANPRYALINEQIFAARGEDVHISIDGPERLSTHADTIARRRRVRACNGTCRSVRRRPPRTGTPRRASLESSWPSAPNSPFLFGKDLRRETRIALCPAGGVDAVIRDRLLGIIGARCLTHIHTAEWQARTLRSIDATDRSLDRRDALREMLRRYVEHMHSSEPVHTWPLD